MLASNSQIHLPASVSLVQRLQTCAIGADLGGAWGQTWDSENARQALCLLSGIFSPIVLCVWDVRLERWLSGHKHMLLLQKTVQVSTSTSYPMAHNHLCSRESGTFTSWDTTTQSLLKKKKNEQADFKDSFKKIFQLVCGCVWVWFIYVVHTRVSLDSGT